MAILSNWVCLPGVRRTNGGSTHNFDLIAEATVSENGINRVEFAISVNGVAHSTVSVTSPSLRIPNFSEAPSRMPDGRPAWFIGYGISLLMSDFATGRISVVATVFANSGNSYTLPEVMSVYNDRDGADNRPRALTIYLDGDSGIDTANGLSWATAVKTVGGALTRGRAASGECGGLIVRCRGTIADISGGVFPQTHTSGEWWIEFRAEPGCVVNCQSVANGPRYWSMGGSGPVCRQRMVGFNWNAKTSAIGFVWGSGVTIAHNWFDNCEMTAEGYLGPNDWTVKYVENGGGGEFIGWDGDTSRVRRYYTGILRRGARQGFEQSTLLYNSICRDFLGIAAKIGSQSGQFVICNFVMMAQRYVPRVVRGYVRMDNSSQGFPCPALTVTKPTASTARITGPVAGYEFNIDATDLVNDTRYGLKFVGSGLGLDTSTTALPVTQVGSTGGQPWVEVTAPSATAGSIAAGACSFYTAGLTTGLEYWYLHPDGIQYETNLLRGITSDCAIVDCPGMQSYFTSGYNQRLCLWRNLRDAGTGNDLNWNQTTLLAGPTLEIRDCLVKNMTHVGQMQTNVPDWTGTEIVNCVLVSGGQTDQAPSRGATVRYNHWLSGPTVGTNATSGAWFNGNQAVSPFPFAPSSGNMATGAPDVVDHPAARYSASGSTRGVTRQIGNLDWTDPTSGGLPTLIAQAVTTIGLSYSAQAVANNRISATSTLALSYIAQAVNKIVASVTGPTKQTIGLTYEFHVTRASLNTAQAITTIGLSYDFRINNLTGIAALTVVPLLYLTEAVNRLVGQATTTIDISVDHSASTRITAQASTTIGISGTITAVAGSPINTVSATTIIGTSGPITAVVRSVSRATTTIGIAIRMEGLLGERVRTGPSPRRRSGLASLLRRMPRIWRWQ